MEQFEILDLIPQRPPIVMVDGLNYCDDSKTISHFFIKPENVFCENNLFLEAGLIENIAQTAAARMGYLTKIKGGEPLVGYIGAVKNLNIFFLPESETQLITEVHIESEIMGFTLITGKVTSNGKIAADCEMRIFLLAE
ncbi:MAG: hydroxymyristoyl-ACP dehydratase [Bacteroidales bacterium]|nr:hydroxymyristoyl-ACP dehydratase [Bacteroidales bacterium]